MKSWGLKTGSIALSLVTAIACSKGEETLDKRQTKLNDVLDAKAEANNNNAANASPKDQQAPAQQPQAQPQALPEVAFESLTLAAAKGLEAVPAEELTSTELIEKVSENELVIFGKEGKSYVYKIGSKEAPKEIEPVVVPPEGAKLFSLPDEQFWFVGPENLGRRKAAVPVADMQQNVANAITVEQFSTKSLQGDVKKIKVLFAGTNEIILHLDTHIAILAVKLVDKEYKSLLNQFEIDGLPVNLKGAVQAGKTSNGGYWFYANSQLSLLQPNDKGTGLVWSKGTLSLPEGSSQIAMILDSASKKAVGGTYILGANGLQEAGVPAPADGAAAP